MKIGFYFDFLLYWFWVLFLPFFSSLFFLKIAKSLAFLFVSFCSPMRSLAVFVVAILNRVATHALMKFACAGLWFVARRTTNGRGCCCCGCCHVVDLPSCLSSVLRFSIASSNPSFAALVHHSRANSFD